MRQTPRGHGHRRRAASGTVHRHHPKERADDLHTQAAHQGDRGGTRRLGAGISGNRSRAVRHDPRRSHDGEDRARSPRAASTWSARSSCTCASARTLLAGRKVELYVGDSGGVPAQARTKIQELVERNRIHVMIGPLAAAEALAADDYIRQQQLPTLSVAAAEDLTQRKPNPWFVRGTSTSSQCAHPLADYSLQGAQVPPHGGHRRRHRLRPRDVRGLPARVRGAGRQDRAEDVPAAHGARLRHLPGAVEDQHRFHLPRLRRLQRLPLPAAVQRVRPAREGDPGGRHDRARRGGAAQHGRGGARDTHLVLVLRRDRQPPEPEVRRRLPRGSQVRSRASTPRRPIRRRPCCRRRSKPSRGRSRTSPPS